MVLVRDDTPANQHGVGAAAAVLARRGAGSGSSIDGYESVIVFLFFFLGSQAQHWPLTIDSGAHSGPPQLPQRGRLAR